MAIVKGIPTIIAFVRWAVVLGAIYLIVEDQRKKDWEFFRSLRSTKTSTTARSSRTNSVQQITVGPGTNSPIIPTSGWRFWGQSDSPYRIRFKERSTLWYVQTRDPKITDGAGWINCLSHEDLANKFPYDLPSYDQVIAVQYSSYSNQVAVIRHL